MRIGTIPILIQPRLHEWIWQGGFYRRFKFSFQLPLQPISITNLLPQCIFNFIKFRNYLLKVFTTMEMRSILLTKQFYIVRQ